VKAGRIITGVLLIFIGGYYFLATNADNTVCRSALISALAPQRCNEISAIHWISGIGALAGIALVVWAVTVSTALLSERRLLK
jgi:hypothetical protein